MVICFECSLETKQLIDQILENGSYRDMSQLIAVAVSNMSVLHKEIAATGVAVIGNGAVTPAINPPALCLQSTAHNSDVPAPASRVVQANEIPALFLLDGLTEKPATLAKVEKDEALRGQPITLDQWLFGQFNKFLPAKVNCRALARMLCNEPDGVILNRAGAEIAEKAAVLGDYLRKLDKRNDRGRDDAYAVAFPETGTEGQKGRVRYANHFVGSSNKDGVVLGLLADLKLIARSSGKDTRVTLTEPGWDLARLKNPVLDSSAGKLSAEEIEFFLTHIKEYVPVEAFAYKAILESVTSGANAPESLDEALKKYAALPSAKSLSPAFFSTQRSGAVARMLDLGLLERHRNGVRVTYLASADGKSFMSQN